MTGKVWGVLLGVLLLPYGAGAQQLKLAGASLVECPGGKPCFRLNVNAVDENGEPVPVPADPGGFRVFVDGLGSGPAEFKPFYVLATADSAAKVARPANYLMLLLDNSGSMRTLLKDGRTRFDAARDAIRVLVRQLQERDRFALATFDSHAVRNRIASAPFDDSSRLAMARIDALPAPPSTNNTALYTAIDEALKSLSLHERRGQNVKLVVFSDGKNDVHPEKGDDRGLWADEGLELVKKNINAAGIEIVTVGFGSRGDPSFPEEVLRVLASPDRSNYHFAADSGALGNILIKEQNRSLSNRLRLTFGEVASSKASLNASVLRFKVRTTLNGKPVESTEIVWEPPSLGEAPFAGALDGDEGVALIKASTADIQPPGMFASAWISRFAALGLFSALLAIGWFGLPRMFWPERYIPKPKFTMPPQALRGTSTGSGTMPQRAPTAPRTSRPSPPGGRPPDLSAELPPPPRPPRPSGAPPRGRPNPPARDPGESTIYIPRGKKYEKDS